ncbi:hypothetical protein HOC37_04715 [bacterium]|nr:hypothetical protein [bacterium]
MVNLKDQLALDKYGGLYKTHFWGADLGLSYLKNSEMELMGTEFEANLFDTGIEVRSEVGYFDDQSLGRRYLKGIIGADYAFPEMITILGEYFYNGIGAVDAANYDADIITTYNWNLARHYLAASISYVYNPLASFSLVGISNLVDGSFYTGLTYSYSLSDESTLALGCVMFDGDDDTEFSSYATSYYLKLGYYF